MRDKVRFSRLCALLEKADTFADVGCDHGFFSEYMLKNDLCRKAYASDISKECLKKAEKRLKEYIDVGRCEPVVADGLGGVPESTDLVLIAGLGGMETVHILKNGFIPKKFVLQPMKNASAVREELLARGARIERDFVFQSGGTFYDVLCGTREGERVEYSKAELLLGRENVRLRSLDFLACLDRMIEKKKAVLMRELPQGERRRIEEDLALLEGVKKGEIG